eukprot:11840335-Alexandrium_andersonii.AAC.1
MRPPAELKHTSLPALASALAASTGRSASAARKATRQRWRSSAMRPSWTSPRLGTRPPSAAK